MAFPNVSGAKVQPEKVGAGGGVNTAHSPTVRGCSHPERPFRMMWVCVGWKERKSKVKETEFLLALKLEEGTRRKVKAVEGEHGSLVPPDPTPSAPPSDSGVSPTGAADQEQSSDTGWWAC